MSTFVDVELQSFGKVKISPVQSIYGLCGFDVIMKHRKNELCGNEGMSSKQAETVRGLVRKDFRKIAPNGFGDPYNAYPHGMTWFQDHLYVGTTRANLANRAKQVASKTPDRLGEIWPVRIPKSYFDNDLRAEIWRYYPPTDQWSRVFVSPLVRGVDGFDVPLSVGFRCMIPFQGLSDSVPALYVPTWGSHQTPTTYMLRSIDGVNFEIVSEPGQCIPEHKPRSLRGLVSFKGYLFTSPVVGQKRLDPNIAGFMVILVSSDPARGDWRLACEPHFGDPNNLSVFHMTTFNGYLYAGTLNVNEGFQIWKTDAEGEPPFKWKKVLSHGAYRGRLNQIAMTLRSFNDYLYVGSAIQNCSFDFDNNIGPSPPEVLRINPDDSWDLIVGDPRITPDGLKVPLSGLGSGMGNPFSGYIWSMCVHEGWLYTATAVWAVFLRYAGREDRWPEKLRGIFTPKNVEKMLQNFGGCDLWRTMDGSRWEPVTQNGFDNCFNIGFRNMVSSPHGLFVGAANPFSPEVAVKRIAGWNYEPNSRGGLEIWLGSRDHPDFALPSDSLEKTSTCLIKNQLINDKTKESDTASLERIISKFYGDSGFRHFGYWRVGINDAKAACENLMDEILAFIPKVKGTIVDIGCGLGATTQYLLKYFPPEMVTGITIDRKSLEACKKKVPCVNFLYGELPNWELSAESFDFVIWVKGFDELGVRHELLQESFRILKPSGRLVCFDVIYAIMIKGSLREKVGMVGTPLRNMDEYRDVLLSTGFKGVRIADVTAESLECFQKFRTRYFGLKKLTGEIEMNMLQKIEAYLQIVETSVRQCLLFSAYKPKIGHKSLLGTKDQ